MLDHRALLVLILGFALALATPVPAWGEYKLNTQYPPWPSRPCADFGASACFDADGREDLLVSRGMVSRAGPSDAAATYNGSEADENVCRWCVTQARRCGYPVRAVQAMAKQADAESADGWRARATRELRKMAN
ncbi:hypothetical protein BGHDH14_bghG000032000001001 [Blumeria hordei DH14]|uniref:Secreted effector protein n=1 Tax=Blumeria graminis f. sp. hordei (strain DH14) TaxID=546991 RepID=N1J4W5_BLUG1|nr:hypothetical protein BGHDH14_bghG000032000001001 [Blumeria hordei DH14]